MGPHSRLYQGMQASHGANQLIFLGEIFIFSGPFLLLADQPKHSEAVFGLRYL